MNPMAKVPAPVVSLTERRKKIAQAKAQALKPTDTRIQDLESDQLRLIDLALDQEKRLEEQEARMRKLEDRILQLISALTRG
jgi:uncharacterized protein YPO0396